MDRRRFLLKTGLMSAALTAKSATTITALENRLIRP